MGPGPPKSANNHKKTQIFYNMFKHFCTFGNRFFLRFAAQNSICFALPTSLFHRAAGQATRWNKSLGPPPGPPFLQFLAANLSGLRRSTYSGCSSKLSLQTVRGCGDGTPQASSIILLVLLLYATLTSGYWAS